MAAAFDPTELTNLLECGICLNRFQDPRVLPCLHSYCLDCLETHISSSKDANGAFNCPQCRETCLLPDEGVDKFPKNFFVNTMKDVLPKSILHPEEAESSGPIICKHHDQGSGDEHGEAVTFCGQCDAHFCQLCTKHHGMFTKDHKVTPVGDTTDIENKQSVNCELHPNFPINWYCNTCSVPACAECVLAKHSKHTTQNLSATEAALKQDMLDVSKMAAKRIEVLQKIFSEVRSSEAKMGADLDKVSKDISKTADSLCKLVRQHESTLQDQIKEAREKAKKKFKDAEENLQRTKDNISKLRSQADALQQAQSEQALCTVLQAQVTKRQYLHQQDFAVSSAKWSLKKQSSQHGGLNESNFLGSVVCNTFIESREFFEAHEVSLGSPLNITPLEYKGELAICSITPIYKSMICVAHFYDREIWVYSDGGELQKQVDIPGIEGISGLATVDKESGKLAIVDNKQSKVYFVSLSHDLVMQHNVCKEIPIVPHLICVNHHGELVLTSIEGGRVIVLSFDGKIISDIQIPISDKSPAIFGIHQTQSGFVISNKSSAKVYFTDTKGRILHTSSVSTLPWQALQTSWGHILVADSDSHVINVFSETGEALGKVRDDTMVHPYALHINEVGLHKILYIGCGPVGAMEVRTYKLAPGDLPLLPVAQSITNIQVDAKIIKV